MLHCLYCLGLCREVGVEALVGLHVNIGRPVQGLEKHGLCREMIRPYLRIASGIEDLGKTGFFGKDVEAYALYRAPEIKIEESGLRSNLPPCDIDEDDSILYRGQVVPGK